MGTAVKPYGDEDKSKKQEVAEMFNNISKKYDFLNHFLSVGIDKIWRKKAVAQFKDIQPKRLLDLATGTGDFALALLKLNPTEIVGMDISAGMLDVGREKMKQKGVSDIISMQLGDSENLPFEDGYFDGLTVGFGVRNYENLEKGLSEMLRVLRPGGKLVVLEFSRPQQPLFRKMCDFYTNVITPGVGRLFANNKDAYQYLNDSVQAFPEGAQFLNILNDAGFTQTYLKKLSFGICTIYCGSK